MPRWRVDYIGKMLSTLGKRSCCDFRSSLRAALAVFFSLAPWSAPAQAVNKVPQFDIAAACRAMIAQPDIEHGQSQADDIKHCIESEKRAREQLDTEWSRFTGIARTTCLGISSVGSVKPVYSELMTCLERMSRSQRR